MKEKLISVGKGALIAAAGAFLAYAAAWASSADLGAYGPLLGAALSVAVNALRKYVEPATPPAEDDDPEEG